MEFKFLFIAGGSLLLSSCAPGLYQPGRASYSRYDIQPARGTDTALQNLVSPYGASVRQTMTTVIGSLETTLVKKQPENPLGYFMTDALMASAAKVFNRRIDVAFMNQGGIRINELRAGQITTGQIYELMPFDNLVVLLNMNGRILKQLFDHAAGRGGWPVSGGTYTIQVKEASDIIIGNQPLNPDATYVVAISDYIADGGDDCTMLANLEKTTMGYTQRDAILDYVKAITKTGAVIKAPVPNRIKHIR